VRPKPTTRRPGIENQTGRAASRHQPGARVAITVAGTAGPSLADRRRHGHGVEIGGQRRRYLRRRHVYRAAIRVVGLGRAAQGGQISVDPGARQRRDHVARADTFSNKCCA